MGQRTNQQYLQDQANQQKAHPRECEYRVEWYLDKLNCKYTFKSIRFKPGVLEILDFYIPRSKIALMVDSTWHPKRVEKFQEAYPRIKLKFISSQQLDSADSGFEYMKRVLEY